MKFINLKSPGWWLFFLFLGLKLAHVVGWSWVWVTAPLWISAAASVVMYVTAYLLYCKVRKVVAARKDFDGLIATLKGGGV